MAGRGHTAADHLPSAKRAGPVGEPEVPVEHQRKTVPRRPGSAAARFIDRSTALPNRMALLTEIGFALAQFPYSVAVVMVEADPPELHQGYGGDGATETVIALADRLRDAVRPTDFVGRIGRFQVGAALWGWEQGHPPEAMEELVRQGLVGLQIPSARRAPILQVGSGVARPGQSPTVALTGAWCALRFSKPIRPAR